jgi:glycosyltransferase involved in cell wall biosynthesis
VDPQRVLAIEWGADVEHFRPAALDRPRGDRIICVFAGAFRSWHGVVHLAAALARLHAAGDHRFGALFVGDGPERAAVERVARGVPGIAFTGAVPHADLPKMLASADIGVAPFDPTRHRPLQLGFYWSPLKLFEYMAVGLPVVAPALPRLTRLVTHNREGLLYDPRDPRALDGAIQTLADDRLRRRMGEEARARVVRDFSWDAHCRVLSARLTKLIKR